MVSTCCILNVISKTQSRFKDRVCVKKNLLLTKPLRDPENMSFLRKKNTGPGFILILLNSVTAFVIC